MIYNGYVAGHKKSGPGKLIWPDNSKFEGEFDAGSANGKGKYCDEKS